MTYSLNTVLIALTANYNASMLDCSAEKNLIEEAIFLQTDLSSLGVSVIDLNIQLFGLKLGIAIPLLIIFAFFYFLSRRLRYLSRFNFHIEQTLSLAMGKLNKETISPIDYLGALAINSSGAHENGSRPISFSEDQGSEDTYVFIKERNNLVKIFLKDITHFEGFGDYVKMHTSQRIYTVHLKLSEIEERLKALDFMRVHRSYIIRLGKVDLIQNKKVFINDNEIPVSNSYWELLVEAIPKF